MTITIDSIGIKVKNKMLSIKTGTIVEDKLLKMPIALIPKVKWDQDVKIAIIEALIKAGELTTVVAMSDADKKK